MKNPMEITVHELSALQQSRLAYILLDVRDTSERNICNLQKSMHIPLGRLPLMCEDLPPDVLVVVYCHHGIRSMQACLMLQQKGFTKLKSLKGGIDAWAKEIDKSMHRY
jgi:rhodanese-related sulfurtransferase